MTTWTAHTIREYRQSLGMSQTEFAKAIGVSRMGVAHWERERRRPRGITLAKVEAFKQRQDGCTCSCPIHPRASYALWSDEEQQELRRIIEAEGTIRDAQRLLQERFGKLRSFGAIYQVAEKIGLTFSHPNWLTTSEAGRLLGISRYVVRKLILRGVLHARRHQAVGRRNYTRNYWFEVHRSEIDRYRQETLHG